MNQQRLPPGSYTKILLVCKCSLWFYRKIKIHSSFLDIQDLNCPGGSIVRNRSCYSNAVVRHSHQWIRLLHLLIAVLIIHNPVCITPIVVLLQNGKYMSMITRCLMIWHYINIWLLWNIFKFFLFVMDYQMSQSQICCSKLLLWSIPPEVQV